MAHLAALYARALGEHDDPGAPGQQRPALLHHLDKSPHALAPVDVDHVQAANRPAKKRHAQQLFLEHIGQRARHDRRHEEGFVGGLVLDEQHHALLFLRGQVLHAGDAGADAHDDAGRVHTELEPGPRNAVARAAAGTEQPHQQDGQRVGHHGDAHPEHVKDGTDQGHIYSVFWFWRLPIKRK